MSFVIANFGGKLQTFQTRRKLLHLGAAAGTIEDVELA